MHYQNIVVEGEDVRAFVQQVPPGATMALIFGEKRDGTPVLAVTASIGPDHGATELDRRRWRFGETPC